MRYSFAALAAVVAATVLAAAPTASSEPLPNPEPVPVPGVGVEAGPGATVSGTIGGGEVRVSAPSVATNSYADPVNMVPNINGDPCTGAWESVACYAMHFDTPPAVQPRSEISSSP